ncbi:putative outer membrane protein, probably involved in nutrient binding [Flavobacteriales bacterium ALC-1]|nr:putative outer membrane protein, probably involved in nutrient binding [Flavobacteriales bacterium ALC-1]
MKKIVLIVLSSMLFLTACEDLDQAPDNQAEADSLTNFSAVLNAAYYYQQGAATPMAVMGDFRADNMLMKEAPYTDFHTYNNDITSTMSDQFFAPIYRNLFKSILSSNNVITNSTDATEVGEAKFLRALSYFKLVLVFGDVPVNLSATPDVNDTSILARQPKSDVYNTVIITDLMDAMSVLDNSEISNGRASQLAAQALLGKVYAAMGDYVNAETHLFNAFSAAVGAGVTLEASYANVVVDNNSEIIFATKLTPTINDEYDASEFSVWFNGTEDKALLPLNPDLATAYDNAGDITRKAFSIDDSPTEMKSVKYPAGLESDWIEIRLSDVILLHAEAMNENGSDTAANILSTLDPIRTRAGLGSLSGTATTQADVRQAILDERRLELAFEGQRWFDLVRTGTVDAEMGQTINSNYYVFPIPNSEILATGGVITQNAGY